MKLIVFFALLVCGIYSTSVEDINEIDILPLEDDETPIMDLEADTPLLDDTDEIVEIDANVIAHVTSKEAEELKPESIIDLYDNAESEVPSDLETSSA